MCQYYAHTFRCQHQTFTFAKFCKAASLIQTPCSRRKVWHNIDMEGPCEDCWVWFPDRDYDTPQQKNEEPKAPLQGVACAK